MKSPRLSPSLICQLLFMFGIVTGSVWATDLAVTGNLTVAGTSALTGNVGIGTTSPARPLHISGSGDIRERIESTSGSGYSVLELYNDSGFGGSFFQMGSTGSGYGGANSTNLVNIQNAPLVLGTANTVRLSILGNGNVGIGTTSPVQPLEVYKAGNSVIAVHQPDTAAAGKYAQLTLTHGSTYFGANDKSWQVVSNGLATGEADLAFQYWNGTAYNERVRITSAGNVGIGTTNPTQKLSVAGTIQAKEVIVQTGWSDYVFDESYKLPTLSEVESRIKAEHHLPGIPSAQEVADHGIRMGEMQSKLLAKIEELTLHQIAQEKQLAAQAARIDQLEADNAALRNH